MYKSQTTKNIIETEYEMQLREKVEKEILRLEYERRQEKVKEQEKKLLEQMNAYEDSYRAAAIITKTEETMRKVAGKNKTPIEPSPLKQPVTQSMAGSSILINHSLFQSRQKPEPTSKSFQKQKPSSILTARRS